MTNQLKQYVDANLIERRGAWYYYNNEQLGQKEVAETKLNKLILDGTVENLGLVKTAQDKQPSVLPPSMSTPEIDDEGAKSEGLLPVTKPGPVINPALSNQSEAPENIQDIFKPLAADLGDIETRKKGGRFKIFVFGIDSRLKDHPLVKSCPYEFRHNDKQRNVRSGKTVFNEGWTVLSKKLIEMDPRTGKPWLTVARDDTPDGDMFTVSNYVLVYADKNQFKRKKGKMAMENMLRTSKMADARQEAAEKMAVASTLDPEQSIRGYMSANNADQSIAREQLEKNQKFTSNEAQEYIDNLNTLGTRDSDIDAEVEKMRQLVDSGKVGKTVLSSKPLKMDEL